MTNQKKMGILVQDTLREIHVRDDNIRTQRQVLSYRQ